MVSLYGQGIFREDDVIEMGVENGAAPTSGARYTYGGAGNPKFLLENPDGDAEIETRIKDRPNLGPTVDAETGPSSRGVPPWAGARREHRAWED